MINLFDFFKAFESIVDREEAESGSQLGDGKEEPRIGRDENAVKRIKRKIVPKRNTRGRKKVQVGKGKGRSVDQDSDNEYGFDSDEGDQEQSRPRKGQSEMVTEQNVKFARFIKSLGELQFLGFVKPTTRKTDHVVRLTWGRV
ncbi:hypothetical protein BKA69DRAFT_51803 [Paraphysoderma sedebokerense]|nr:hypothetical protein BKA69DRAFT_51803 [Paraphysoderma sedebokerense]